jgi:serine phosphatase RsbU (regulator of sigma subunit)
MPDAKVSGLHCQVSGKPSQPNLTVTDLNSTNGSFVDGQRVQGAARLRPGGLLQVGEQIFRHDYLVPSEVRKAEEIGRDLDKARHYVLSLLPAPIIAGPVLTDWVFQPSTDLGGDAFGYHQLTEHTFAGYLVDVSGHGVGAAIHSVSVMNVLRQRALPHTDFHDPGQVLCSLNDMFQMNSHDDMYFSAWYGVYDTQTRGLRYASAGHHPAYLVAPSRELAVPLQTRNLLIGAMPGASFKSASVEVPVGGRLYVFSDGVFEVTTRECTQWGLADFLPLLTAPLVQGTKESARLLAAVQQVAQAGPLEDDASLLVVTFL